MQCDTCAQLGSSIACNRGGDSSFGIGATQLSSVESRGCLRTQCDLFRNERWILPIWRNVMHSVTLWYQLLIPWFKPLGKLWFATWMASINLGRQERYLATLLRGDCKVGKHPWVFLVGQNNTQSASLKAHFAWGTKCMSGWMDRCKLQRDATSILEAWSVSVS